MCSISSIRLNVFILSYIKSLIALYFFVIGIYLGSYKPIGNAFGSNFTTYGGGLAFLGVMSGLVNIPLRHAMSRHNRFLLVFCFFIDLLVFTFLIYLGNKFYQLTFPLFPKSLQLDCSRYIRQTHTLQECLPFYNSPRTAGFRLFWENYYTRKSNSRAFQVLSTIQGDGCCGFFAPLQCRNNTEPFPSYLSKKGISSTFLSQRVTCGYKPNFYPQQSDCANYYDIALGIVGGCNYDLGVSYCLEKTLDQYSLGCASYVEDYATKLVGPHGIAVMILSSFNFIMMLFACCMWWKRKESDVFPDFIAKKGAVNYFRVRGQFQIFPSDGLLLKEEYLPNTKSSISSKKYSRKFDNQIVSGKVNNNNTPNVSNKTTNEVVNNDNNNENDDNSGSQESEEEEKSIV